MVGATIGLRSVLRGLTRRPGVTATAVLSLALGIGPNAALFSLLDGLGLRPLPIERADRLVRVLGTNNERPSDSFSAADYGDLAAAAPAFSSMAAFGMRGAALTAPGRASEVVMLAVVSRNYFATLGVRAQAGRVFAAQPDAAAAVISDRLWRERYDGSPAAIARGIELNGHPFPIAGVAPRDFAGLDPLIAPDVWIPLDGWTAVGGSPFELSDRASRWLRVIGRLHDEATIGQASAQMATLMAGLARSHPATNAGRGSRLIFDTEYRTRLSRSAAVAFGLVGVFVLLLACANVAGLLLASGEERRHEIALRTAIGASRARLAGQLVTESIVLAALAAVSGLGVAWMLVRALPAAIPPMPIPLGLVFRLDMRAVLFAVAIAGLTVLVFGIAPAVVASRADTSQMLKASSVLRTAGRSRVRNLLVSAQIAVALAVLTSAVFLARGVSNLAAVDTGFAKQPMLIVVLSASAVGHDEAHARAFYDTLTARISALPGVEAVTFAKRAPLSLSGGGAIETVSIAGLQPPAGESGFAVHYNIVGPRYFTTMGTAIVEGRDFVDADTKAAPCVAIASEAFAKRFWPEGGAAGRRIGVGPGGVKPCQIVGVARDGKYNALDETADPYLYFSFAQRFAGEATLLVRTAGDPRAQAEPIRQVMTSIDRRVPAMQMVTLTDHLHAAMAVPRIAAWIVAALGALGVFLAVVGLYALVAYLVGCRVREIGIRMALGARPIDITHDVLRQAAKPVATGIGAGILLAVTVAALTARFIYGVHAADPVAYAAAACLLGMVALAASLIPARRAARVDPAHTLRRE